ncbi:hypothetical protein AAFF_G00062870 [Aldrovandia affinis]|uniref:Uncharacterized protein n=1 Tax=Aldrovandia affinis TaxID=143900 RepID=A0AAD7RZW2_9TELE|nr:hypothetical protein AAFF_G00062870 [Aldrovandia affinis]
MLIHFLSAKCLSLHSPASGSGEVYNQDSANYPPVGAGKCGAAGPAERDGRGSPQNKTPTHKGPHAFTGGSAQYTIKSNTELPAQRLLCLNPCPIMPEKRRCFLCGRDAVECTDTAYLERQQEQDGKEKGREGEAD